MSEEREDAGLDAAPEGGSEGARPDTDEGPREGQAGDERALEDEGAVTDPDADQPDPESEPASGA